MKDLVLERWLTETMKVPFEYREGVPLTDIDAAASLKNQARLFRALDDDLVAQYAVAMKAGARFPALLGWVRDDGQVVLCGGNHRLQAAFKARRKTCDLYVLHVTDAPVIDAITRQANMLVGQRQDQGTNLSHAVHAVEALGVPVKQAAKQFQLTKGQLERALRIERTKDRLGKAQALPRGIKDTMLDRLAAIANDPALAAAAKVAVESRLTTVEQEELRRDVVALRSEAEMLAAIAAFAERPEIARRRAKEVASPGIARAQAELARLVHSLRNFQARRPQVFRQLDASEQAELRESLAAVFQQWEDGNGAVCPSDGTTGVAAAAI